jgi:protein phosphatase
VQRLLAEEQPGSGEPLEPIELLERAVRLLSETPPVLRLDGERFLLVGDTHGFPEVSEWAFRVAEKEDADHIVFIGDYVDRGPRGVENLELLLGRLLAEPGRVVLLRGNHESLFMNYYYGFREEAEAKRGQEYIEAVERLYRVMPYVALLPEGVMVVHGGVPCRRCGYRPEDPVTLGEIEERLNRIKGSEEASEPSEPLAMQLLWNDPRGNIEWFMPSPRGPGIYLYGREAWTSFLRENSLRLLIRAHEVVDAVHVWLRDGSQRRGLEDGDELSLDSLEYSVVTVFSSLYHRGGAGALLLDAAERVLRVHRFPNE